MTRKFFITLAVALLGFIATKAQAPFTGRVEYEFVSRIDAPDMPVKLAIEYGPKYLKLIPLTIKDSSSHDEMELVIDYTSGQMYELMHAAQKVIIKEKQIRPFLLQMTHMPENKKTFVGAKASLYETKVDGSQFYDVWLSDSITVTVSDAVSQNSDFFIFGTGKILLKAAPKTEQIVKGELQDMTINAVKIIPYIIADSSYQLPANYAIEDAAALNRLQDSLLRQFQNVDSALAQQKFNEDSARWLADEANSYLKKKPPSPKKPQKKAPAKGNKPPARRPKQ
jgi:hypothetical protein